MTCYRDDSYDAWEKNEDITSQGGGVMGTLLHCLACDEGPLKWVDPEVDDLDADMVCEACGEVYHGLGDWIERRWSDE